MHCCVSNTRVKVSEDCHRQTPPQINLLTKLARKPQDKRFVAATQTGPASLLHLPLCLYVTVYFLTTSTQWARKLFYSRLESHSPVVFSPSPVPSPSVLSHIQHSPFPALPVKTFTHEIMHRIMLVPFKNTKRAREANKHITTHRNDNCFSKQYLIESFLQQSHLTCLLRFRSDLSNVSHYAQNIQDTKIYNQKSI